MSVMTLQLPNTFVEIDKDEMEYIDGGNYSIYISNVMLKSILSAAGADTSASSISAHMGSIASQIANGNALLQFLLISNASNFGITAALALQQNKGINIYVTTQGLDIPTPVGVSFQVK